MLTATKPTVRTDNPAQMRAVQQANNYVTRPLLGRPDVWEVQNVRNGARYEVDLQTGACTCPHFTNRLVETGECCKHFELVNLILITSQARPAPEPVIPAKPAASEKRGKRWEEMSREERLFAMFGPDC